MNVGLIAAAALNLIVLHQPDGREIAINTAQITSLYAALPNKPNRLVAPGSRCLIGLADGKFASVIETCVAVRRLIEDKYK
jgi:hypothetical protein